MKLRAGRASICYSKRLSASLIAYLLNFSVFDDEGFTYEITVHTENKMVDCHAIVPAATSVGMLESFILQFSFKVCLNSCLHPGRFVILL